MLIEREREVATLASLVGDAANSAGRFVLVQGEAGLGKTSLLAEAVRLAARAGARTLTARGTELERGFSFGLVRQWYEPLLCALDEHERAQVTAGAASSSSGVFDVLEPDAPAIGDLAALHGLYWLTANLAEGRPLLLTADDLHWADPGSLRFLAYLLPRLDGLPVLVVGATRPGEPGADQRLLDLVSIDPESTVLRLAPLSPAGSTVLLDRALAADDLEVGFAASCHSATGGNPLLLTELARSLVEADLAPTAANATRVERLGAEGLSARVRAWLGRLPADCTALANAVAVAGDGTPLYRVAAIAGLDLNLAISAAEQLEKVAILTMTRSEPAGDQHGDIGAVAFVHPVTRAAVYDQVSGGHLIAAHTTAARLLGEAGEDPERVALHLLRVPPAADPAVVDTLRRAATAAMRRGMPETALVYLERCGQEPPGVAERQAVLEQLGLTALTVDAPKAVGYLDRALRATRASPSQRAVLADALGSALFYSGQHSRGADVYQAALAELTTDQPGLRRQLQANLINFWLAAPSTAKLASDMVDQVRHADDGYELGHRMLDGAVAFHDALVLATPDALDRAWRCVADGTIIGQLNTIAISQAALVLNAGDRIEVADLLDTALKRARKDGSILGQSLAEIQRAGAWHICGPLSEAETSIRDVVRLVDVAQLHVARPQVAAVHADILMDQGRLEDAGRALAWAGDPADLASMTQSVWLMDCRARWLLQSGRPNASLDVSRQCGARCAALGWQNPAIIAWRPTAALALHLLGRSDEARSYAGEQLNLARRWGAPRAHGHALRVAGLVGGGDCLEQLREAVAVLEHSPAQLEHAKALVDLGAAHRRRSHRTDARAALTNGAALAHLFGADSVARKAETELRAMGARPKQVRVAGLDALTPSERRVAKLAAHGLSNRAIAQELFVTVKTVEVHLSRAYLKLGISSRVQLSNVMAGASPGR